MNDVYLCVRNTTLFTVGKMYYGKPTVKQPNEVTFTDDEGDSNTVNSKVIKTRFLLLRDYLWIKDEALIKVVTGTSVFIGFIHSGSVELNTYGKSIVLTDCVYINNNTARYDGGEYDVILNQVDSFSNLTMVERVLYNKIYRDVKANTD